MIRVALVWIVLFSSSLGAQCPPDVLDCPGGICPVGITLNPYHGDVNRLSTIPVSLEKSPLLQVSRAVVRVTVGGTCGSGTVVGFNDAGSALVLTNAHVAGTSKGRVVNVQRWGLNGDSERAKAKIVSSGYGRGMSIDFALLEAEPGFAKGVIPVPMVNRSPDPSEPVITMGCPRCEWPSLQVLNWVKHDSQVQHWRPPAIGGRSGSSVVELTADGPRVVGLLTWGNNSEGLGQSSRFVIGAISGTLPKSLDSLPADAIELAAEDRSIIDDIVDDEGPQVPVPDPVPDAEPPAVVLPPVPPVEGRPWLTFLIQLLLSFFAGGLSWETVKKFQGYSNDLESLKGPKGRGGI